METYGGKNRDGRSQLDEIERHNIDIVDADAAALDLDEAEERRDERRCTRDVGADDADLFHALGLERQTVQERLRRVDRPDNEIVNRHLALGRPKTRWMRVSVRTRRLFNWIQ